MFGFMAIFNDMKITKIFYLVFAGLVFFDAGAALALEADSSATVEIQTSARTEPDFGGGYEISASSAVVGKAFILDGTKSQDDGVVHTYIWKQVSGPFKFATKEGITASFTPTVAGTYVFELVVTDSSGRSTVAQSKTITVTVNPGSAAKPTGDPDFDLKSAPSGENIGDTDRDGSSDRTINPGSGDPDFDLLIEVGAGVEVRGWDPKKKEEIISHPENVNTADDLKIYAEATLLNDPVLKGIKIRENFIEVGSREQGKFLWLIPVEMDTKIEVYFNPKEYDLDKNVKVKFPWWSFLVRKSAPAASLEADLDAQMVSKIESFTIKQSIRSHAEALSLVSSVLKTRHDTAKNSVGNIR